MFLQNLLLIFTFFIFSCSVQIVEGTQFNVFSQLSVLSSEGKVHLESLSEKAKVPQHGKCWKKAISELQTGCKSLSEEIQNDLALKFTDCFLQMSGYEPVKCESPKSFCAKKLSDRAFNAYTEFYTHTQSICYFLQNQMWQEEAEITVNKLSSTSTEVAKKLQEAEIVQEKLLQHQHQSLLLQNDLIKNSENVASVLKASEDKINTVIKDFQSSTVEQKQLLLEVFENLLSLREWAVNEMSWFSSTVFFLSTAIIAYLFTSMSRTKDARILIFVIISFNYAIERILSKLVVENYVTVSYLSLSTESLNSAVWTSRKLSIMLSVLVAIYTAFTYYDFNVQNHKLLLIIKNQNSEILEYLQNKSVNHLVHQNNTSSIKNHFNVTQENALNKQSDSNLRVFNDHTTSLSAYFSESLHVSKSCSRYKLLSSNEGDQIDHIIKEKTSKSESETILSFHNENKEISERFKTSKLYIEGRPSYKSMYNKNTTKEKKR